MVEEKNQSQDVSSNLHMITVAYRYVQREGREGEGEGEANNYNMMGISGIRRRIRRRGGVEEEETEKER